MNKLLDGSNASSSGNSSGDKKLDGKGVDRSELKNNGSNTISTQLFRRDRKPVKDVE